MIEEDEERGEKRKKKENNEREKKRNEKKNKKEEDARKFCFTRDSCARRTRERLHTRPRVYKNLRLNINVCM